MLFGTNYFTFSFSEFDVNSTLSLIHPSLKTPCLVRQHLFYEIIRSMLATPAKII